MKYSVDDINRINESYQESFCECDCPLRESTENEEGYPIENCKCGWDNCPVKAFLKTARKEWEDLEKPHCYSCKYFRMGETLAGYDMAVCALHDERIRSINDTCKDYEKEPED